MKKVVLIILVVIVSSYVKGQFSQNWDYSISFGTGMPMNEIRNISYLWQMAAHYNINRRISVGAGTGISIYEKALIPLFANVSFLMTRPHRFTPYMDCNVGYSVAPDKNANGGFYIHPDIGV